MKEFNWSEFKSENIAVNCKTKEESMIFMSQCEEHNIHIRSTLKEKSFKTYLYQTCYGAKKQGIHDSTLFYGSMDWFEDGEYTIIEWSDYMDTQEFTKDMLKDGMIVEARNGDISMVLGNRLLAPDGCCSLKDWNDKLCEKHNKKWDIIMIYTPIHDSMLDINDIFNKENLELIWKRKEEEKQSIIEKNKFENISNEELLNELKARMLK